MDQHHRHPFLPSPPGHHPHHQRSLLYHPRPRHQLAMPSLPIYDGLLSPSNRHSFPRPYPEDYPPPSFLPGPNPGPYGLMGGSYPIPVDYSYGFPGGYPFPIPPLPPSHNSFMSLRKASDDAAQYQAQYHAQYQTQYQAHVEAFQDQMNSYLRLPSPAEPGKTNRKTGHRKPDYSSAEAPPLPGRNGKTTMGDVVSAPRHLPRLSSPPRRRPFSSWHSTLALSPPPLHLPTIKQSSLAHPGLHPTSERSNSDAKKRKMTHDLEPTLNRNGGGVLSEDRIDDLFLEHFVAKMRKLPPLLVGNKDLAKKLTAIESSGEALNLSISRLAMAEKSSVRVESDSPGGDGNRMEVERCAAWEPVDGRNQNFVRKNQSAGGDGTGRNGFQGDGGFGKDLGATEHANQRGFPQHPSGYSHRQDLPKSPRNSQPSTASSYLPPPHPQTSSTCLTDIEAMRSAYASIRSKSSSVGCSEGDFSTRFSPLLPPPPPLGFRGKGCFGAKRRRLVSPPEVVLSSSAAVFSPRPPGVPFQVEYGRGWDWSAENGSLECGSVGRSFDVDNRSAIYRAEHIAMPLNVTEETTPNEPNLIHIKQEPIECDTNDPFTQNVNNSFSSHDDIGAVEGQTLASDLRNEGQSLASDLRDEGQSLAYNLRDEGQSLAYDLRDTEHHYGEYDHDQTCLPQEDTDTFLNVPFVDSTEGGLLSPDFKSSSNPAAAYRFSSAPASALAPGSALTPGSGLTTGSAPASILAPSLSADDGAGEFRCHLCNYNGRSQHCLDKHFRAHSQACKICRYCLKAFERPSDLVRHEERHQKRNHTLASTTSNPDRPAPRFPLTAKHAKRRHAWTCRQCPFTCREARKLIQHTRRAHPIFIDCRICRMKFTSEPELLIHRAECHPVVVGRLDSYSRGVLTATRLLTCVAIGEQEIALDLAELSELPDDCSGIPVVSSVHDVQCILGKESEDEQCAVQDLGHVGFSDDVCVEVGLPLVEASGVPQLSPSPLDYRCERVKSPTNPPNLTSVESPKDATCVDFDGLSTDILTSILTVPKTDDVVAGGDAYDSPPDSGHFKNVPQDRPRWSAFRSADARNILEKSPIESLRRSQFSRVSVDSTWNPPLENSPPSLSSCPRPGTTPKFRSASHQKRPSLLTNLLSKPKTVAQPATAKVLETLGRNIDDAVCALDNRGMVLVGVDVERTSVAENGTDTAEKTTPQVPASKKEPEISVALKKESAIYKNEPSSSKKELVISKKEAGTSKKESGTSKNESGTSMKESGTSMKESGTSKKESGTSMKESVTSTKELAASKNEPPTSKKHLAASRKDCSAISPPKPEKISTTSEGVTNSRKVFAERNGISKRPETFVCVRCKYSTNAKFKYQQHLKAHSGRFICKRCNKACIKSSDLYRHWVTHNVKGPDGYFACDSCDFTSPQKYVVEDHMKLHYTLHPEQPQRLLSAISRCGICQKNVLRSRLFEHKRVAHGKFFLKPRVDAVETDANGNSIKSSLKVFACPQCDRKFTTPSYLLRHHFLHHRPPDEAAKPEENSCSCRFCGVKFEDVDRLQDHEINHILQTCTDTEYVNRCRKRKKRPIESKTCSEVPVGETVSVKPLRAGSPGRRRLGCPHCKKTFKVQYFLEQHLRIHSGERPYVCQQCGAGFPIFQLLNVHRRFKCHQRRPNQPTTTKPLLSSCSVGDSFCSASSECGDAMLNGADSGEAKDCDVSAIVRADERAVEHEVST